MDEILAAIDAEIGRLQQVRSLLASVDESTAYRTPHKATVAADAAPRKRARRKMSKEARKRMAEAQRKRWAATKAAKK
jgi:hypothetical protein